MRRARGLVLTALAACAGLTAPAFAHTRSQSFSTWTIDGRAAAFNFEVDARRVTQLALLDDGAPGLEDLLDAHLRETVLVEQSGRPCPLADLSAPVMRDATLRAAGRFECAQDIGKAPARAVITSFQAVSPTHIHLARLAGADETSAFVLREGKAEIELSARPAPSGFAGFVSAGFHHVLSGIDHAAFLLALLLAAASLRLAVLSITGFTLGHTVSLALASLGAVAPDEAFIEALIGFTIVATAIEAGGRYGLNRRAAMLALGAASLVVFLAPFGMRAPPVAAFGVTAFCFFIAQVPGALVLRLTPAVSAAFGLVHGAGFAGGLKELGLARNEIAMPLLGFNAGVEFAQLAVLSIVAGAFLLLRERAPNLVPYAALGSGASLAALGAFWFAVRVWS